jgi:hypothetical protein
LGWDAVDAAAALTGGAEAYGEIVWSWRRKAGAKLANWFAGDGGNRAKLTGESAYKP